MKIGYANFHFKTADKCHFSNGYRVILYPGSKPSRAASKPKNEPSLAWDPGLVKSMYLFVSANLSKLQIQFQNQKSDDFNF